MTDDIVTQLQEAERLTRNGEMDRDDIGDILDWCADEIERLQTQLKQWQALCDTYYHKLALEPDNTFYFISGYRFLAQGGK